MVVCLFTDVFSSSKSWLAKCNYIFILYVLFVWAHLNLSEGRLLSAFAEFPFSIHVSLFVCLSPRRALNTHFLSSFSRMSQVWIPAYTPVFSGVFRWNIRVGGRRQFCSYLFRQLLNTPQFSLSYCRMASSHSSFMCHHLTYESVWSWSVWWRVLSWWLFFFPAMWFSPYLDETSNR